MKNRISHALYKDGIISKKEIEIVDFGIESMVGTFFSLFITLIIGVYFDLTVEGVMFYFFPYRYVRMQEDIMQKQRYVVVFFQF